jgi:hypothetical protein
MIRIVWVYALYFSNWIKIIELLNAINIVVLLWSIIKIRVTNGSIFYISIKVGKGCGRWIIYRVGIFRLLILSVLLKTMSKFFVCINQILSI